MSKDYMLSTGVSDQRRLEILFKLYSPTTTQFLIENELKHGMTVLEFGCGMGDMSCWLAQYVGNSGKVIAIDSSESSLTIAREKAKSKNLQNIEFFCMDVNEIEKLGQSFDFIYGNLCTIKPYFMIE